MAYFDTTPVSGFTLRVHYEENLGVVTITNVQMRSTVYGGTWWPGGTIKVNGETVLTMRYTGTATHYFYIYSAGDAFVDIEKQSGVALPVASVQILKESTEITVDVELYRTDGTKITGISGTETVRLTAGLVYIDTGSGFERYLVYVDNGTGWDHCIPYIDDGTSWVMCS